MADVAVANFFTVSEYAPFRTGEIGSISDVRLKEDHAFASLAHVSLQDLDLLDAPLRLNIDMPQLSTTRALGAQDEPVVTRIAEHISAHGADLLFVPLALGDHIDHRIAQQAAMQADAENICFYEDLPYAARLHDQAPAERAEDLGLSLAPYEISAPDGQAWKGQCAGLYKSQIDLSTVREISDYSFRYKEGERFWITPQASEKFASLRDLLKPALRPPHPK